MTTVRDESFIPYSMIEPLLKDGMTGRQLGDAIMERIGLTRERHGLVCFAPTTIPLRDGLQQGLHVISRESASLFRDGKNDLVR